MSTLFYRALATRMAAYPQDVNEVETLYSQATAIVDELRLDEAGDVVVETERFRTKLREYDTAMLACMNRAEAIAADMHSDIASAEEYEKSRGHNLSLGDQIATLVVEYSRLVALRQLCKEHRKIAERGRRMIAQAQESRSVKRINILVREMESLDNEVR